MHNIHHICLLYLFDAENFFSQLSGLFKGKFFNWYPINLIYK